MGSLDFQATYARWLRLYGNAEAIEPTATAALARLRPRGPSTHAALCGESTARALGRAFVPLDQPLTTQLGCVLPTAASQSDALLQVIEPITSGDTGRRGAIDLSDILSIDLLVDLMKCVIIDARVELSMAAQALAGSVGEFSTRAERAFVEPPPWPPASIVELRKKPQGPGLIDSLLTQLTPDVSARRWLGVSWDRPPAPLDSASVRALASAEGGALLTAPRIRAWLRAEWAAWARQRFRRVARLARGRLTP
jgi:hypothetical protein